MANNEFSDADLGMDDAAVGITPAAKPTAGLQKVYIGPEPADHGLSERQKLSPMQKAINPITSYPETYNRMNLEAQEQVAHGVDQITKPDNGAWETTKGVGNTVLGAAGYVASPVTAAYRTVVGQPLEDTVGIPREYTEFAAQLATPGIGIVGPKKVPTAKQLPPKPNVGDDVILSEGQATGNLSAIQREQAALRDETMGKPAHEHAVAFKDQQAGQLAQKEAEVTRNLDPSGGQIIAENPQQAAQMAQDVIQTESARSKATVKGAYDRAKAMPGEVHADVFKNMGDDIKTDLTYRPDAVVIDDKLTPMASHMIRDVDERIAQLQIQNRAQPPSRGLAPLGDDSQIVGINLEGVEQVRKRLSTFRGDALKSGNQTDARAAQAVLDAFDKRIDDAITNGMFTGDARAVDAWKAARAAHTERLKTYGNDAVGKKIQAIVGDAKLGKDPVSLQQVGNFIWGESGVAANEMNLNVAKRVQKILGKDSPEWAALRQAYFQKLVSSPEGEAAKGAGTIATRISKGLNGRLAETMFTPAQRDMLREYAALHRSLEVPQAGANWSNTSTFMNRATDAIKAKLASIVGMAIGYAVSPIPIVGEGIGLAVGSKLSNSVENAKNARQIQRQMPLVADRVKQWQQAVKVHQRNNTRLTQGKTALAATNVAGALSKLGIDSATSARLMQGAEGPGSSQAKERAEGGRVEEPEPEVGGVAPDADGMRRVYIGGADNLAAQAGHDIRTQQGRLPATSTDANVEQAMMPDVGEPAIGDGGQFSAGTKPGNKLFGTGGEERFQTWPERMIRSGATLPGDVYSGKEAMLPPGLRREDYTDIPAPTEPTDDSTWLGKQFGMAPVGAQPNDAVYERAQDTAGMAGGAGLMTGVTEAATLGSTAFLRPAMKHGEKIYKGKPGQQHADVIPDQLYPDFQKRAMAGDDISDFQFGFMNHKGQFLDRQKAMDYALEHNLLNPEYAAKIKGELPSNVLLEDSATPGAAISALEKEGLHSQALKLYHGTGRDFDKFDLPKTDLGVHFGSSKQANARLSDNATYNSVDQQARVIPAEVGIKKPLLMEDIGDWDIGRSHYGVGELVHALKKTGKFSEKEISNIASKPPEEAVLAARELISSKGYDGVKYLNRQEGISKFHDGYIEAPDHVFKKHHPEAEYSYISFNPGSVKSKLTGQTLLEDSATAGAPLAALENAPHFYSAVEKTVADAKQTKMHGEQWANWLKNQPGVKPDEMQYTGLDSWLREQKGPVTKQQVQDFVRDNKVEVQDVVKGGKPKKLDDLSKTELNDLFEHYSNSSDTPIEQVARDHRNGRNWDDLQDHLEGIQGFTAEYGGGKASDTKYHDYQLPGGENYREHLLTLPRKTATPEEIAAGKARTDETGNPVIGEAYQSSHWDEPNILAHVRTNERDVGGVPSLHLEELQSDWHQAGRKKGYKQEVSPEERKATAERDWASRNEIDDAIVEAAENHFGNTNNLTMRDITGMRDKVLTDSGELPSWTSTPRVEQAIKNYKESFNAALEMDRKLKGVPDAPFKKDWAELGMKRMLRQAVEDGKSRISWTPGEAQAARYDLSKHLDSLEYNPETGSLIGRKGGSVPLQKSDVKPDQLEAMVGKDVAQKLMEQDPRGNPSLDWSVAEMPGGGTYQIVGKDGSSVNLHGNEFLTRQEAESYLANANKTQKELGGYKYLNGLDLKVGGEGMKGFYDNMLPKMVEKLGKQYGVKVKQGETGGKKLDVRVEPMPSGGWTTYVNGQRTGAIGKGLTEEQALHVAKQSAEQSFAGRQAPSKAEPVMYFDIPPKMKEDILSKGFPLFSDTSAGGMLHDHNADRNKKKIVGPAHEKKAGGKVDQHAVNRAAGGRVVASNINTNPSPAQIAAGNYAKDHISLFGLNITIENAKGSIRRGVDSNGKSWSCKLPAAYGYIKGSEGADGDHLDVYVGPYTKSDKVFVINQIDKDTSKFDETKTMLCFGSIEQALSCYTKAFSDGKALERIGSIVPTDIKTFKEWVAGSDHHKAFKLL